MKCVDRVRKLAESVGASVDAACRFDIVVDAPAGYVWSATGDAVLCEPCENTSGESWRAEACRAVIADMRYGLYKCDAKTAAEIAFIRDESWTAPEGAPEVIAVKEG